MRWVNPSKLARKEATRELLSFLGVGGSILAMAGLAQDSTVELDPRSPDFGKMKLGETRLDFWSGYAQYLRCIAQMATAQGKTQSGRISQKDRMDLITRFAQSKFSPLVGLINDLIQGETFLGEDMPPRSRKGVQGQLYNRMMPLAIQDMVDGYLEASWSGGLLASIGFYGVGVVTYTDELKRTRDREAQKVYGMSWEEVGQQLGRAEQLKLEQTSAAIQTAQKEQEKEHSGATPSTMDTFQSFGKTAEQTYRDDIDNAVRQFRATNDGVLFRERVGDATKARRKSYATRARMPEFQDIMAYYQQPIRPEDLVKLNPGDIARREFTSLMFAPNMYDEFGEYRFDVAEQKEQEFVKKYGQQALDYIEEYQSARWLDKPAELKMLEQAKDVLRPYWQIEDQIWALYPPQMKLVSDQIKLMERTDPERARLFLRRFPAILRARDLIATYKKQMREGNPVI